MTEARRFELSLLASKEKSGPWHATLGEARRRLRILRIEADCEQVPTDLTRFAKHLGIPIIRETVLPMKGRLLRERDGFSVEVNIKLEPFERRFTVAHELAHLIVEGDELRRSGRVSRGKAETGHSNRWTERLCDELATELLLPHDWIRERIGASVPRLDLLLDVVRESDSSVDAVAARVLEIGLWTCRFIWWTRRHGYFRALKTIPFVDDVFLPFIAPGSQRTTLLRQATAQGQVVEGEDVVRFRDERVAGSCQCMRTGEAEVLALFEPRRPVG